MKKYLIVNNDGTKKTIYAKDLMQALKLSDAVNEAYNPEYSIQQFKSYIHNIIKDLYGNDYNRETVRAISKLDACVSQVIDDFEADIKNSNLDKRKTVQYYTQYVDALYEEITDVANVRNIDGQSLKKIDDIHAKMARSIHDSKFKDEANLPTTLQALVNDEEAAIKAYEVAIKNLEDKIDENQMQVLINIMKDERKHIENLYAILNNQVTEKNLEDSIKDSVKDSATKDTDGSIGIIFNKLYNSDYDSFDEVKRDFDRLKSTFSDAEKEKIYKEIAFTFGMTISSVKQRLEDSIKDAAPGVDKKKFDRLVSYFNAWGKPSRNELQEVIDYYRLNSATAYQLLYYWGYKNEFEKLHFYDSRIRDTFEVSWYTDEKLDNYETKEFRSRAAAMNFYNAHEDDKDKFGWWVTRRNSDWAVVEDIVY